MGAGILPVSLFNGKLYFLFSREYKYSNFSDAGKWSDFGGSREKNETHFETAIREGWEESDGFLGTKDDIRNLLKYNLIKTITDEKKNYKTYLIFIPFDNQLPLSFKKKFKYIEQNKPYLIAKRGRYEKDKLEWIEFNDIQNRYNSFRPWYRNIIDQIKEEDFDF